MIAYFLKSFFPGIISVLLALVVLSGCGSNKERATDRTLRSKPVAFVKNTTCAECHSKQYQEWSGSHHDLAMQTVTDKTVLGDFNETSFTHFGVTSHFFKKDRKFFVNTEGPDGKMADFEIRYAFGVEPLQQYLIEFPGGRLQSLTIKTATHPRTRPRGWWSVSRIRIPAPRSKPAHGATRAATQSVMNSSTALL